MGDGPQVDLGQRGVGRGLHEHQAGVRAQRVRDAGRIGPGDLGPEQPGGQQVVAAAVQGPYGDDVPQPHRAADQQDRAQRGHAAGEGDGGLGPLQPGQRRLETGDGRIAQAAVDRRAVRLGAGGGERVDASGLAPAVVRRVGRGQVDGRGVQSLGGEVVAAGVHGFGGQCPARGCGGAYVVERCRVRAR